MQMETKEESLGGRGGSLETDSQQQQQQLRQSLRNSISASDSQVGRQLQASHAALGEESGSQLAARLNSSAFGTDQVLIALILCSRPQGNAVSSIRLWASFGTLFCLQSSVSVSLC